MSRNAFKQGGHAIIEITNDTEVFDAMRFDVVSGDMVWTGRVGTREAIRREKLAVDQFSWKSCPHQWLDERGFVSRLEFSAVGQLFLIVVAIVIF